MTFYRHKNGFSGPCDYLEYHDNGEIWLHFRDGSRVLSQGYTLGACEGFVKDGSWVKENFTLSGEFRRVVKKNLHPLEPFYIINESIST
jgi:hypothetical protein